MASTAVRSAWKGSISFGMVTIPVKMYSASSAGGIKFNQFHNPDFCPGPRASSARLADLRYELRPHMVKILADYPDNIDSITGMPTLKVEWDDVDNALISLEEQMADSELQEEEKLRAAAVALQDAMDTTLGSPSTEVKTTVAPSARKVGRKEVCAHCQETVDRLEIQRGYVIGKDQVVLMDAADFENLPVPTMKAIQVVQFVEAGAIDLRHLEKPYLISPDEAGGKAFALLLRGMESKGRVAVAKLSMRGREHLVVMRPHGDALLLHTLFYDDEIRDAPAVALPEISEQELDLAGQLISALEGEWDATKHADNYQAALLERIEAKVAGTPIEVPDMPEPVPVQDLTAGLLASIQAVKAQAA